MALTDTPTSYGLISRFNHWVVALLVLVMLGIGLYFADLPRGDEKTFWLQMHMAIGALTAVFVVLRVLWRAVSRRTQPFPQARFLQVTTDIVHGVLMLALVIMVVTGPLTVWTAGRPVAPFDLFSIASPTGEMHNLHEILEQVHVVTAYILMGALALHILGMLKHLVFDRQVLMGRMVGSIKPEASAE